MISREKLLEILRGLKSRTDDRQVNWHANFDLGSPVRFYVAFSHSTLSLSYRSPRTDFDRIEVDIYSRADTEIVVGSAQVTEEDNDWAWVKGFYDEVDRQVTGSDLVLDEIEGAIKSREPIGAE